MCNGRRHIYSWHRPHNFSKVLFLGHFEYDSIDIIHQLIMLFKGKKKNYQNK